MNKIDYTIRAMQELKTMVRRKDYGFTRAIDAAISSLQEQANREKENKPLTLEQLKQMNKKPVWVVGKRELEAGVNGWMLIDTKSSSPAARDFTKSCNFADYDKLWLAYAREPVSK